MPDDPSFIQMIAENPDDDALRLIYADVLEETGEPLKVARAEFIRLDIESRHLPPDDDRGPELRQRLRTALMTHALAWWRELPSPRGIAWDWFVRGFAERLQGRIDVFLKHSSQLFSAAPLRSIQLSALTLENIRALAELPELSRIRTLEFIISSRDYFRRARHQESLGEAEATALAQSPYLKNLTMLLTHNTELSSRAVRILYQRFGALWLDDPLRTVRGGLHGF